MKKKKVNKDTVKDKYLDVFHKAQYNPCKQGKQTLKHDGAKNSISACITVVFTIDNTKTTTTITKN